MRAGLSDQLFKGLNVWFRHLPGGLLHTNLVACGVFSAVSGSSVATAATIGSVALPFFHRSNYDKRMVLGTLAAGGALGNLIPPGITFIIYGMLTETSVGQLYVAAILPSLLVLTLFIAVVFIHGVRRGRAESASPGVQPVLLLRSLADLGPTTVLIIVVLGSIYGGFATLDRSGRH